MSGLEKSRQWFLIAQAHGNTIQLFSLPLGSKQNNGDSDYEDCSNEDHDVGLNDIPFYLTSKLVVPDGGRILKIGFYGDDGKSSLSSGLDSGTGMERRQKIGFIYQMDASTEIWTTAYDSLSWQAVPFDPMLLNSSQVDRKCTKDILSYALGESRDDYEDILLAHCKIHYYRAFMLRLLQGYGAPASHIYLFS